MNTTSRLDQLRLETPACRAVGYADIALGTVLATSADPVLSQEKWDDLCATAEDLLIGASGTAARRAVGHGDAVDYAAVLVGPDCAVCVGSPKEPDCAICALCSPDVDVATFAAAARRTLSDIASDA